jgi:WD40 repeat protein
MRSLHLSFVSVLAVMQGIILAGFLLEVPHIRETQDYPHELWLSPEARYFARSGTRGVSLFDVQAGSLLAHIPSAKKIAFSADGTTAAILSLTAIQLWDLQQGKVGRTIPAGTVEFRPLAISPDGKKVACPTGNGEITIWDTVTGRRIGGLAPKENHGESIDSLCFSPDGRSLASGGKDAMLGSEVIKIWETANQKALQVLNGPRYTPVRGLSFSPDGKMLLTTGSNWLWDLQLAKAVRGFPGRYELAYFPRFFSPDGDTIVLMISDGGWYHYVALISAADGKERLRLPTDQGWLWAAAYSKGSRLLVTANSAGSIKYWDPVTGALVRTVHGLTLPWLALRLQLLMWVGLVWIISWALVFPRLSRYRDNLRFQKDRTTWYFATAVGVWTTLNSLFMTWLQLATMDHGLLAIIVMLIVLPLAQLVLGIVVVTACVVARPNVLAALSALIVLGFLGYTTYGLWSQFVAAC